MSEPPKANESGIADIERAAVAAARAAGEIIRAGYRGARGATTVEHKGRVDLVTDVDLAAEKAVIEVLREQFPRHAILSEEAGEVSGGERDFQWMIDPLDGTTNYAHGHPHCSVSIACLEAGTPIAAVVYDPMRDELFSASTEEPTRLNGDRVSVSRQPSLQDSLLATGFAYDRRERASFYIPIFQAFMCAGQGVRRMGSAALDLAWLAAGRVDGFWEAGLHAWDVAAGVLLVERAGGTVSDYRGLAFEVTRPDYVVASNGRIHAEMLDVLKEHLS